MTYDDVIKKYGMKPADGCGVGQFQATDGKCYSEDDNNPQWARDAGIMGEENCDALCRGKKMVAEAASQLPKMFSPAHQGANIAKAVGLDGWGEKLDDYGNRVVLVALGAILLFAAVFWMFKEPASGIAKTAIKELL